MPFGWRVEDGVLIEIPEQQAAIAKASALRREGKSLRAIAAVLTSDGFRLSRDGVKGILTA